MTTRFTSFVVFAEMRTGSNFLEANLNAFDGIACHGEAFNPHFIGYPNTTQILGVDQAARDMEPAALLRAIKHEQGVMGGFRYFHDHDPRVLDLVLDDPNCAKIILTRNPVESYVSWKIAQATGQWKLTDMKARKAAKADFVPAEFEAHLEALQNFQLLLMNRLQTSGQTAFYVAYEDLQSVEVMNGIAAYLGVADRLEGLDKNLKKQNPSPLSEKVSNYALLEQTLSRLDRFDLTRTPNFEPRRGPNVPGYVAGVRAPLIFMPAAGGPDQEVRRWLAALDGQKQNALGKKMTQKELRQWKRQNVGHRSFTVLRHPLARAHEVFCHRIMNAGQGSYLQLRRTLVRRYKLPLPEEGQENDIDLASHRACFIAFLTFLKGNLAGQTAIRVDPEWATQAQVVQGFGEFTLPDLILREEGLAAHLDSLAKEVGYTEAPRVAPASHRGNFTLEDFYDAEIESLCADVYQRDYMMFGYGPWRA
ncbi:sulfotransferase family 2 domain-containing protein [Sulfitobacter donghicola]|uniref:Nodulation protein NodH n=1 Tax=Sulfitobacter donghicola DSW-25 = KCTC 12864 = JCM 14565 TaxID=1300350 RepID=A0A073ILT5_9RHOB|nr:sulfotransferase family 2 domain-containing protein [Sulfitobacter donghicola]KEJ90709.1 nodulation protein NodH [Sulfitobacter donghicola DSW-25 = KCTC 12864 = JCM 14565]KIN67962.1 Nodulation protein H [Sulfitobacter donghicola DSW-25 = KCTC 12864 = JCM 14565]